MHVERLLQISIATLTVLGPLLLGVGERFPTLPLWVLIAAVSSLWLTDTVGWVQLNRTATNLAAIGALALSIGELSQFQGGVDIPSLARLLVYLQLILLFQKKEFRTYWQLAVLSLVQVIVAAAFNQGASFGLLMIAYLFVGLSALALFFLFRDRSAADCHDEPPAPIPLEGTRWPLTGQEPVFVSSRVEEPSGVGREFWGRVTKMTAGTLLLTVLIFSAVPRLGSGARYGTGLSLQRMVGFSDVVTLGALGTVIEDPQELFVAEFVDHATGDPYSVVGGVYFRGAVLTDYSKDSGSIGSWTALGRPRFHGRQAPLAPIGPPSTDGLVRQQITIQPMDREELFCVWPFVGIQRDDRLEFDSWRQRLLRHGQAGTRFSYQLGTSAFVDHMQRSIVPAGGPVNPRRLLGMPSSGGAYGVSELTRLAAEWLRETDLPEPDRLGRARWLEHMLRDSGDFQYSLQGQVREAGIDPIEDFVKNNRRGHCEYFATALAMMLRSQNIPSRLVIGFKTNEWNDLGQFYQVRQLHAHTWVEAYLEPRHVPPAMLHAGRPSEWAHGAWVRLDPTPAARDMSLESGGSIWDRLDSYFSWLDYVWTSYVMDMDRPRQEEAIYNPVIGAVKKLMDTLTDATFWSGLAGSLKRWALALRDGRWFNWQGLLAACAVLALLPVAYVGLRWLWRRLVPGRGTGGSSRAAGRLAVQVEFYGRLEALLARFGLIRATPQTQREFAQHARTSLLESTGSADVASVPCEVVEAFYRVRFGGRTLDSAQVQAVEQALAKLSDATAQG